MAGNSKRFTDVGVTTPKWALTAGGRTLLGWAFFSVADLLDTSRVVLVAREEDAAVLGQTLDGSPLREQPRVVFSAPGPRRGQAVDSALAVSALSASEQRQPVVVWNADTLVTGATDFPAGGNWLQLAPKSGDQWSFAQLDGTRVVRTAEKERISSWASTGLYGFASGHVFLDLVRQGAATDGETYVAPLYNALIAAGERVSGVLVPGHSVVPLGTPEQFVSACRGQGWTLPAELAGVAGTGI